MIPRRLALLAALLLPPRLARGHSELRGSEPAAGAVLAGQPAAFRLVFDQPVQVTLFRLLDASGQAHPLRREAEAAPAREALAHPAAPLPPGSWRIEWRAISADGHPIRGSIPFRLRDPAP